MDSQNIVIMSNGKSEQKTPSPPAESGSDSPSTNLAVPRTKEETGLPESFLGDLILKLLYTRGMMAGYEIASALCLHFTGVVEPLLSDLRHGHLVEV